jgi:hypothetical protein
MAPRESLTFPPARTAGPTRLEAACPPPVGGFLDSVLTAPCPGRSAAPVCPPRCAVCTVSSGPTYSYIHMCMKGGVVLLALGCCAVCRPQRLMYGWDLRDFTLIVEPPVHVICCRFVTLRGAPIPSDGVPVQLQPAGRPSLRYSGPRVHRPKRSLRCW